MSPRIDQFGMIVPGTDQVNPEEWQRLGYYGPPASTTPFTGIQGQAAQVPGMMVNPPGTPNPLVTPPQGLGMDGTNLLQQGFQAASNWANIFG